MTSIIVSVDAYRTLAFGSISGSFTAVGTPFGHPVRLLKLLNTCDTDMIFSFDGATSNDYVPAGSFALYDLATNGDSSNVGWFFRTNTQVYVMQASAPSKGAVYVIALYGQGE